MTNKKVTGICIKLANTYLQLIRHPNVITIEKEDKIALCTQKTLECIKQRALGITTFRDYYGWKVLSYQCHSVISAIIICKYDFAERMRLRVDRRKRFKNKILKIVADYN